MMRMRQVPLAARMPENSGPQSHLLESLPCRNAMTIISRAIIIAALTVSFPEKGEWEENCQQQLKRGRKAHVSPPKSVQPALESEIMRR